MSSKERRQKERSKKYDCDGCCYTATSMCPKVEFCEETRKCEFVAVVTAGLIMFGIPIITIVTIVTKIVRCW